MDEKKLKEFKVWLQEEELSANTINSYLFAVSDFFKKHEAMDNTSLIEWKQNMLKSKSPKTVNLRLCAIDKWIEFTRSDIRKPKRVRYHKQTTVENAMDIDTYNYLLRCLDADGNFRWIAYYKLLATTGARISEALSMTKADLDQKKVEILTKNKVRRIYIPAKLSEECSSVWGALKPGELLITNRYGGAMTSRGFASMMKKHAALYNIPPEKMHPHAFRHLFAIEFLKRNGDISLLADLLGHSSVNTTMIYTRRSEKEQNDEFNKAVDW